MLFGFFGLMAIVTSAGLIASGAETLTTFCATSGAEKIARIMTASGMGALIILVESGLQKEKFFNERLTN